MIWTKSYGTFYTKNAIHVPTDKVVNDVMDVYNFNVNSININHLRSDSIYKKDDKYAPKLSS